MKMLEHIAQEIVEKTSEILDYPISITDNEGMIIGSTDKSRIGIFHQPSLEVIKNNVMVDCKSQLEKKILPGVSAPIKFNNKVIGVLGIVGNPREVEKYVQLVKNQVEMMCQEAFRNEMVELKEKMVEMFVHQVINLQDKDPEKIEPIAHYAKLLEYDINKERVCLLINIHSLSEKIAEKNQVFGTFQYFQKEVLNFLHLIFHENKDDIVSLLDFERFIIIKSLPYQQSFSRLLESIDEKLHKINAFLKTKYHVSASISVGDVSNCLNGISESYHNALKALRIGMKVEQETNTFIYNERETLLWLLPKELNPAYQKKLLKIISSLINHDSYDVLSSTFLGFCKYKMNLSEASRNLFIHRNTIIYRLEKISELTSLNTSSFEHCMLLYTAIQCYEETKQKKDLNLVNR